MQKKRQTFQAFFGKALLADILEKRGPTAGPQTNFFGQRIITVISVITIGLSCVPKIPVMAIGKFAQM